jgi:hypothetical protein
VFTGICRTFCWVGSRPTGPSTGGRCRRHAWTSGSA